MNAQNNAIYSGAGLVRFALSYEDGVRATRDRRMAFHLDGLWLHAGVWSASPPSFPSLQAKPQSNRSKPNDQGSAPRIKTIINQEDFSKSRYRVLMRIPMAEKFLVRSFTFAGGQEAAYREAVKVLAKMQAVWDRRHKVSPWATLADLRLQPPPRPRGPQGKLKKSEAA